MYIAVLCVFVCVCVCVCVVVAGKSVVAVGRKSTSSNKMKHTSIRCLFSVRHLALANCEYKGKERYTLSRNELHIHMPSGLNNVLILHIYVCVRVQNNVCTHTRVATSISSTVWCILHSSASESMYALVLRTSTIDCVIA